MAENLFSDFPERWNAILKSSDIEKLVTPLEEHFGEKDFFKSNQEALDFFRTVLDELGKVCAKEIKPTAETIDREGAKYQNGEVTYPEALSLHLKRLVDLGLFAGPLSRKWEGHNLPRSIQFIALELLGQACPNTALTTAGFSMADYIELYGTEEQKKRIIPKIISNEWRTSMALTEPNAGSDLGKIRTSARRSGDRWIVNGTKIFITNGQADLTFALVRTDPTSTGLSGLTVLLVPKTIEGRENFKVTKIEDKVCLHSSPTCELVFENSVGELFGTEGEGFKVMADLMNEARLAMAGLAVGIAVGAYDAAKNYAKTRTTMGKPILEHPMVADMLYEMELEIRGMRALCIEATRSYDWLRIAKARGDEKELRRWKKRYRRLTPLCKYYCAEKVVTITKNAVQIFGGYGVCRDYPVERYYREAIIYPIYEGTSQIQSLMVLKDTLKDVAAQAGGFLGSLAGAWAEAKVTRDPVKSAVLRARHQLNFGIKTIMMSIIREKFRSDIDALRQQKIQQFIKEFSLQLLTSKSDLTYPFLYAERFTRITCDYYALKSMADHHRPGDTESEREILNYADLVLPRMEMENRNMLERLPATLDWIKTQA